MITTKSCSGPSNPYRPHSTALFVTSSDTIGSTRRTLYLCHPFSSVPVDHGLRSTFVIGCPIVYRSTLLLSPRRPGQDKRHRPLVAFLASLSLLSHAICGPGPRLQVVVSDICRQPSSNRAKISPLQRQIEHGGPSADDTGRISDLLP